MVCTQSAGSSYHRSRKRQGAGYPQVEGIGRASQPSHLPQNQTSSTQELGITPEYSQPLKPQLPRLLNNSDLSATNSLLLIHGFRGIRRGTWGYVNSLRSQFSPLSLLTLLIKLSLLLIVPLPRCLTFGVSIAPLVLTGSTPVFG